MNNNRLYLILGGGIVILVMVTLVLTLRGFGGGGAARANLTFWGVFDDRNTFERVIANYKALYPGVSVNYRAFAFEDYERNLIDALAAGSGPDIIMIHNTWLPKHQDKLKPAPDQLPGEDNKFFTKAEYQSQFVEVANQDLVRGNDIYGFPLYVDTLALFYNRDIFNNEGITAPPRTWDDFNQYIQALTKYNSNGSIDLAGAAIGTAKNINRSSDILMAMMIQSGAQMTNNINTVSTFSNPVNGEPVGERALEYYTNFADPRSQAYTWNDSLNYSIDAFIEGKAVMMLNYSHQIPIVRAKAARLNFAVAPMPQADPNFSKTYANYWAASVSNKSPNYLEAWRFLRYLTSRDGSIAYLNESMRPAARKDVIELQKNDIDLGLFALQALTAKSWYQADSEGIERIFADMIDTVNAGRLNTRDALRDAEAKVNVLMSKQNDDF